MILFFIIFSSLISSMLSRALNEKIVEKYPKYNLKHSRYTVVLAALINLIVQYKLFNKVTLMSLANSKLHFGILLVFCFLLGIIISGCIAVSCIIDLLYFELPNELNLLIGLSLIPFSILAYSGKSLLAGLLIFAIYFSFAIFTDSFGMGDAKLALALGFGVEFSLLFNFMFLSFLFASIFSIIKIVKYKDKLKSEIAFGPFIILSFLLIF